MKLPKLKSGDLVIVSWLDAFSLREPWTNEEDLDLSPDYSFDSVGYYVSSSKKYFVLAGDRADANDGGQVAYGRVHYLPLGMIEKVERC